MKLFLTSCIILLLASPIIGQNNIGVELGLTFANLTGDSLPDDREAITAITPGIFYEYEFTEKLSLKTIVSYETRGYDYDLVFVADPNDPDFNSVTNIEFRGRYITLTPLVRYKTGLSPNLFINAGPYLGLLVEDSAPVEKSVDVGATIGAGIHVNTPVVDISAEVRGSFGLTNTFDSALPVEENIKTIAYGLVVGVSKSL